MITYCDSKPAIETVTFDGRAMGWEFHGIEDGQILIWAPMQGEYHAELSHGQLVKTRNWWIDEDGMRLVRAFCDENDIPYRVAAVPRPLEEVFMERRRSTRASDPRQLRMFE